MQIDQKVVEFLKIMNDVRRVIVKQNSALNFLELETIAK